MNKQEQSCFDALSAKTPTAADTPMQTGVLLKTVICYAALTP